jgi:hypothetical protein
MKLEDYKKILNKILGETSKEQAGYKSMATSVGKKGETADVKKYMKSKKFKGIAKGAKERAKGADSPNAYLAAVERKVLKGHFSK